jgi:L-asparaginase II
MSDPVLVEVVRGTLVESRHHVAGAIADAHRTADGCSVPTWAMPLKNLASAFARLGTGTGLAPDTATAFARLRAACVQKTCSSTAPAASSPR